MLMQQTCISRNKFPLVASKSSRKFETHMQHGRLTFVEPHENICSIQVTFALYAQNCCNILLCFRSKTYTSLQAAKTHVRH
jgi:hypothetical protein